MVLSESEKEIKLKNKNTSTYDSAVNLSSLHNRYKTTKNTSEI